MKKWVRKKLNRSGTEQCPICLTQAVLVEHHIHGRKIDRFDSAWNKAYICDNCHRKIHMGLVVIEDWVMTSDGMELCWHHQNEDGLTGKDAVVHVYPQ